VSAIFDEKTPAGALMVAWSGVNREAPGPPLFLIHGNWSSRTWWEPTLRLLPPSTRAIAFDLRGRGDTEGPDNDYSIASLADDLAALADALGAPTFHVAGHSLGSAVALECALRYPQRVRSVAALSPAWVDGMPSMFHQATHQQALGSRAALDLALRALSPGVPRDDLWRRCVDGGHRQRMTAALRNLDALTAWRPGDTLGQITAPRAVVSGARDLLTGGATARRAAAALKTPLVLLPNVGHCLPLEAPDLCVAELLRLVGG